MRGGPNLISVLSCCCLCVCWLALKLSRTHTHQIYYSIFALSLSNIKSDKIYSFGRLLTHMPLLFRNAQNTKNNRPIIIQPTDQPTQLYIIGVYKKKRKTTFFYIFDSGLPSYYFFKQFKYQKWIRPKKIYIFYSSAIYLFLKKKILTLAPIRILVFVIPINNFNNTIRTERLRSHIIIFCLLSRGVEIRARKRKQFKEKIVKLSECCTRVYVVFY